jgi:hypothetical protein
VVAGTLGAWAYTRHDVEPHAITGSSAAAAPSPERVALDEAKALCASGDCETARSKIEGAIGEGSVLRSSQDFKDIQTKWADQILARADAEKDTGAREAMYQRVSQAMGVDPTRRKTAADKLQQLEALADTLPSAATSAPAPAPSEKAHAEESVSATPHPEGTRRAAVVYASEAPVAVAVAATPAAAAPAAPAAAKPSAASVDDRERALALQGTPDSKVLLKHQLEQRVNNGKASDSEIRLLIGTCKDLGDRACVQAARAALAQKQE